MKARTDCAHRHSVTLALDEHDAVRIPAPYRAGKLAELRYVFVVVDANEGAITNLTYKGRGVYVKNDGTAGLAPATLRYREPLDSLPPLVVSVVVNALNREAHS